MKGRKMPRAAATKTRATKPAAVQDDLGAEIGKVAGRTATRPVQFASLEDQKTFVNMVYWGKEGSAKTTNALLATTLGKVLVVNAEGGLKVQALRRQGVDPTQVAVYPEKQGDPITHRGLDRLHRQIRKDLQEDPNSWFAIVLDSATEIVAAMVEHVSGDRITKQGITDQVEKFETNRNDYGTMSKMFLDILRKFRDLPCHVIVTALERRDVDEDTKSTAYGPAVSPGIQTSLVGYVDLVLYCKAADERGPYRALVRGVSKYRTKDRFGSLPDVLAEATFPRVLAYVEEQITAAEDPLQDTLPKPREKKSKSKKDDD